MRCASVALQTILMQTPPTTNFVPPPPYSVQFQPMYPATEDTPLVIVHQHGRAIDLEYQQAGKMAIQSWRVFVTIVSCFVIVAISLYSAHAMFALSPWIPVVAQVCFLFAVLLSFFIAFAIMDRGSTANWFWFCLSFFLLLIPQMMHMFNALCVALHSVDGVQFVLVSIPWYYQMMPLLMLCMLVVLVKSVTCLFGLFEMHQQAAWDLYNAVSASLWFTFLLFWCLYLEGKMSLAISFVPMYVYQALTILLMIVFEACWTNWYKHVDFVFLLATTATPGLLIAQGLLSFVSFGANPLYLSLLIPVTSCSMFLVLIYPLLREEEFYK